jgi:rRNA maturation endonuclease Nob1
MYVYLLVYRFFPGMAFEQCPVCGGDLVHKEVEKVLRGGPILRF